MRSINLSKEDLEKIKMLQKTGQEAGEELIKAYEDLRKETRIKLIKRRK